MSSAKSRFTFHLFEVVGYVVGENIADGIFPRGELNG
jgi:hypothetical protein